MQEVTWVFVSRPSLSFLLPSEKLHALQVLELDHVSRSPRRWRRSAGKAWKGLEMLVGHSHPCNPQGPAAFQQ